MFSNAHALRVIPDSFFDGFDWSYIDTLTSAYSGNMSGMFNGCYSLRTLPITLLTHYNRSITYSYSIYYNSGFQNCYSLDEITNLHVYDKASSWTSNGFGVSAFTNSARIKNLTFATNEDSSVKIVKWKNQTIDMTSSVGYTSTTGAKYILNYNSGITADKEVKDDATYQALKDDPDWFSTKIEYSRYNHDSAVATINTLPDASAYLATQSSGTNTIKFKGEAGSATDGGAINTLTEEEIAVATAKGWTVTFV
jgi:hypothetical protein